MDNLGIATSHERRKNIFLPLLQSFVHQLCVQIHSHPHVAQNEWKLNKLDNCIPLVHD